MCVTHIDTGTSEVIAEKDSCVHGLAGYDAPLKVKRTEGDHGPATPTITNAQTLYKPLLCQYVPEKEKKTEHGEIPALTEP